MEKNEIMGFAYKEMDIPSFEVIGFTKITPSQVEAYQEILRNDDVKSEILRKIVKDKPLYCIKSRDKECPKDFWRYTIGKNNDDGHSENEEYKNELFTFQVKESKWLIFTLDVSKECILTGFIKFLHNDPYETIWEAGYEPTTSIVRYIEVHKENYDGHEMEFWIPVKKR